MKTLKISKDLLHQLDERQSLSGRVHSKFDHAININTDEGIFYTFLSSFKPISPMSIKVKRISFENINLIPGDIVTFDKERFEISDEKIYLCKHVWDPFITISEEPMNEKEKLSENTDKLFNFLSLMAKKESFVGILQKELNKKIDFDPSIEFIYPKVREFIRSLMNEDDSKTLDAFSNIVGFGPGLTPSSDDMVIGTLSAIYFYEEKRGENSSNLYKNIYLRAIDKTTKISEEMYKHFSEGKLNELYVDFLNEFFMDGTKLSNLMSEIFKIGSTSGTDYLVGFYLGMKIILDRKREE